MSNDALDTLSDKLSRMFDGGDIKRYHTKRVLREQTVAHHSARIAMLLMLAWPDCSANLLKAAIVHDVSELVTGDVPSPVKWANPALKAELSRITTEYETAHGLRMPLTDTEAMALRWADLCEGAIYCTEEITMGNRYLIGTYRRYIEAARKAAYALAGNNSLTDRVIGITMLVESKGNKLS